MTNLHPEARPDKNGRIVIRHVRADAQSRRTDIPPVSLAYEKASHAVTKIEVKAHTHRIKDLLIDFQLDFFSRRKLMKTLLPETLPTLVEHGVVHRHQNPQAQIPHELISESVRSGNFNLLNDFAAYLKDGGPLPESPHKHMFGKYDPITYLKGLLGNTRSGPNFGFKHYSESSEEERMQQRAVIKATKLANEEHFYALTPSTAMHIVRLNSKALVERIKSNPDDIEELMSVINDRGIDPHTESLDNIDDLIAARRETATPLIDGAL